MRWFVIIAAHDFNSRYLRNFGQCKHGLFTYDVMSVGVIVSEGTGVSMTVGVGFLLSYV